MQRRRAEYFLAGIVSLFAFLAFLPALHNGFVNWDDIDYVTGNPHIRTLNLEFFRWAFLDFYAANWHPLTWMTHAADYAVWGLDPLGHHLSSAIFHAVNAFLVVVLVARLLDAWKRTAIEADRQMFRNGRTGLLAAAVTGLLFSLHPLHVESVAWVSERKDLLCAFFFLPSLLSYMSYGSCKTHREKHYFLSLFFFVLALLSKPMAVSLPVVLLLLDWYPLMRIQTLRTFLSVLVEKIPFAALSLLSSGMTVLAQKSGGALATEEFVPLSARLIAVPYALVEYLRKMILPTDLLPFYAYPRNMSASSLRFIFPILLVAGITLACVVAARRQRLLAAVWCYYVVTLVPVLGIVKVGSQMMADRYTYLPAIGPFLLLGVFAAWISEKLNVPGRRALLFRIGGGAAVALLVASLSYLTIEQTRIWRNSLSLWNFAVEREPEEVSLVYYNRGYAFDELGMTGKAMSDFNRAIALNPSDYRAYIKRGLIFDREGRLDEAISDLDTAVRLKPLSNLAHVSRGILYGKAGLPDKAADDFSKSIEIDQRNFAVYNDRGFSYFLAGKYDLALQDFSRAIELNRDYAFSYLNRGNLYFSMGREGLARSDFQNACRLKNQEGCAALERLSDSAGAPRGK